MSARRLLLEAEGLLRGLSAAEAENAREPLAECLALLADLETNPSLRLSCHSRRSSLIEIHTEREAPEACLKARREAAGFWRARAANMPNERMNTAPAFWSCCGTSSRRWPNTGITTRFAKSFSGGVDRTHPAAATGSTLGSKSRPDDRDGVGSAA